MKRILITMMVSLTLGFLTIPAIGAEGSPLSKPVPAEDGAKEKKKSAHVPFHGKVKSVNPQASSLSLDDRTFVITSTTKITKDGHAAALGDMTVGEEVRGSYVKGDDGKLTALSLYLGAKADKPAKQKSP